MADSAEADRIGQVMYEIKKCEETQKRLDREAGDILGVFSKVQQDLLARDMQTSLSETGLRARVANYPTKEDLVELALKRIDVKKRLSDLREQKEKLGY